MEFLELHLQNDYILIFIILLTNFFKILYYKIYKNLFKRVLFLIL